MRVRARAPGKVNLCLFLGPVRPDGRHELVTVFESISLADELEVVSAPEDQVVCAGVDGLNLVARALDALRRRGWDGPRLHVSIAKRIPVAAGMGGGSADAAAMLRIAQRISPLPGELIAELAAELGADVPSQLTPGVAVGVGAGDEVEPRGALAEHAFVIVPQPHGLSTADVYAEADRLGLPRGSQDLAERLRDVEAALGGNQQLPDRILINDLQPAALSLCPQIDAALDAVRAAGADHAFVCGSGPTVAGLYWASGSHDRAAEAATALTPRFPGTAAVRPVGGEYGSALFA